LTQWGFGDFMGARFLRKRQYISHHGSNQRGVVKMETTQGGHKNREPHRGKKKRAKKRDKKM